jgi:hypothetical protein
MTKTKIPTQKNYFKWSLISAITSLILGFGANFIPLVYFTIVGLPEGGITTTSGGIFDFALIFGYLCGVVLILSLISSVYFYFSKKTTK